MNRRQFLREACGAVAGILVPTSSDLSGFPDRRDGGTPRKLIIVVFGGGTRYSESIGDPGHRHIPRLWNEMIPRGTLFTDVRVEGRRDHQTAELFDDLFAHLGLAEPPGRDVR